MYGISFLDQVLWSAGVKTPATEVFLVSSGVIKHEHDINAKFNLIDLTEVHLERMTQTEYRLLMK